MLELMLKGLCLEIEKLMARYWWWAFESKRKIHWKAWKNISISKRKGGLGFRKFVLYNQALLAKQAWRLLAKPDSLIAQVLKARYFSDKKFLEAKEGSNPSMSWRGICWGKTLLSKGLRRRIGNGHEIRAFNDPWLPRPPSFLPIIQRATDMRVSDFIQQPGEWDEELIKQHFTTPDAQLIQTIPLSTYNHSDAWMWHYTRNGSYTVKSGYNLATSIDDTDASSSSDVLAVWWKEYWEIKIPRKVLLFGWRGFHEILSTGKGLLRRNITTHSNCPVCSFGVDSNAHAVFWCPLAQELWALYEFPFLKGQKEDISFREVMFYASGFLDKDSLAKMLIATWSLWYERNKRIHQQQSRPIWQLKGWICSYHEEIKKARLPEGKGSKGVISAAMNEPESEFNNHSLVVDAAISESTNMIGLGAAIFTPTKRIKATLAKPLKGLLSVLNAEALAVVVGLRWALSTGIPIKKIYSDSLGLVTALNNTNSYHNELGILLIDIKNLLRNLPEVSISHINRKFNVVAHSLGKKALQLNEEVAWMDETPQPEEVSL